MVPIRLLVRPAGRTRALFASIHRVFLVALCLAPVGTPRFAGGDVPVDIVVARKERLRRLLTQLSRDASPRMISGQSLGPAVRARSGYAANVADLVAETVPPQTIALIGVDYGWGQLRRGEIEDANRLIIEHCHGGGIVTICCHPGNPVTGSCDVHDLQPVDVTSLLTPGTAANVRWQQDLEVLADGLAQLQAAGVVVLWRPFHEMNGGWFWWCGRGTSKQDFARLWQHQHEFFTDRCDLQNLLWVYSPTVATDSHVKPVDHYYPGGRYVDVAGLDIYADVFSEHTINASGSFAAVVKLGKPVAIAEAGPLTRDGNFDNLTLLRGLSRHAPQAAYVLVWHSWHEDRRLQHVAIRDNLHGPEFLMSPQLINREELERRLRD